MGEVNLKVILVAHTPDPEEMVALGARLCYSPSTIEELKGKIGTQNQGKLIENLMKMGHMSPLEHASFTFGIEGISRACSHQLVRHRIASYSQQSQRYVGKHSKKNDGVFDFIVPPRVTAAGKKEWFIQKMSEIQIWYDELVEAMVGKGEATFEDARFLLPNATETKIVVTMNARELLHFFTVRCCERAQWEIREMAFQMLQQIKKVAPTIFAQAGPVCLEGPCDQGKMYCGKIDKVRAKFGVVKNVKIKNQNAK